MTRDDAFPTLLCAIAIGAAVVVAVGFAAALWSAYQIRSHCVATGQERQVLRQRPAYLVGKVIVPGTLYTATEEEFRCPDGSRAWL